MEIDLSHLSRFWTRTPARDIIVEAHKHYFAEGGLVMSSHFGSDSMTMIHMARSVIPDIPIIFIDEEGVDDCFALQMRKAYKLNLHVFVKRRGETKSMTLARAFQKLGVRAVIHGIRAYQSELRSTKEVVELGEDNVYRIHPLLYWQQEEVDRYMADHSLPYHPTLPRTIQKIECGIHHFKQAEHA